MVRRKRDRGIVREHGFPPELSYRSYIDRLRVRQKQAAFAGGAEATRRGTSLVALDGLHYKNPSRYRGGSSTSILGYKEYRPRRQPRQKDDRVQRWTFGVAKYP